MFKLLFLIIVLVSCYPKPVNLDAYQKIKQEEYIQTLLKKGNKYLQNHDLDRARASFELAREVKSEDARVFDALGCVSLEKNELDLAKFYFKEAMRLSPQYDRVFAHMAKLAELKGHFNASYYLYQQALLLNPLNASARRNLINLQSRMNIEKSKIDKNILKVEILRNNM